MVKNRKLKLFTKSWPLRGDNKTNVNNSDEEYRRPLTATLEKPTILDIKFIDKIDMSIIRKELFDISNLCRIPLVINRNNSNGQLRHLGSDELYGKSKEKRLKKSNYLELNNIEKINNAKMYNNNKFSLNPMNKKLNNALPAKNNLKGINKDRNRLVDEAGEGKGEVKSMKSTKLNKVPSPCKACYRKNFPERFHSHTTSISRPYCPQQQLLEPSEDKLEVFRLLQINKKPASVLLVKNNSDHPTKHLPTNEVKHLIEMNKAIISNKKMKNNSLILQKNTLSALADEKKSSMKHIAKIRGTSSPLSSVTASKSSSTAPVCIKRTLTCYICGREFGTASLSLHEPKCMEKWERENNNLPLNLRRKPPIKPVSSNQNEWNRLAWETSQAALVPCDNCGRTFYPDRLEVHRRSCKAPVVSKNKSRSAKIFAKSLSLPLKSNQSIRLESTTTLENDKINSKECKNYGKKYGSVSINNHEVKCMKQMRIKNGDSQDAMKNLELVQHQGNGKINNQNSTLKSSNPFKSNNNNNKDEKLVHEVKSSLLPCYLCGKLFTVNSIAIHQPQCMKMWKIENDKLPLNKRRPIPIKPDMKVTRSGKINITDTSDTYWQSHLNHLVPCKFCSRKFNPDRVEVHEKSCKGK